MVLMVELGISNAPRENTILNRHTAMAHCSVNPVEQKINHHRVEAERPNHKKSNQQESKPDCFDRVHDVKADSIDINVNMVPAFGLAVSPDGRTVVFVELPSGQLYRRSVGELDVVPIPGTSNAWLPFFSRDGEWIGYVDQADNALKKIRLDGSQPVTLCPVPFINVAASALTASGVHQSSWLAKWPWNGTPISAGSACSAGGMP